MTRTAKIATVTLLALSLFGVAGVGAFRNLHAQTPPAAQPAPAPKTADLFAPAGASLATIIAELQARLTLAPSDWKSYGYLGLAYVQQARATADPTYYPKAEGALATSLSLQPRKNEVALVGEAALAAGRHDFTGALRYGEQARALDPHDANVYGVIGDAENELGRYPAAFASFQKMVNTLPNLSSYARVSYARELQGDVPGALQAMGLARDVAGTPADVAWADFQTGELYFNSGRPLRARAAYRAGLHADPTYVPNLAGLAKVAWATGDMKAAIAGYNRVVQRYPAPEHVIALGDLYAITGDQTQAQRQYALVRAEEKLFQANGVNIDLEQALFDADHGDAADALMAARTEWGRRHSILVADAYAWALYANGRYAQAAVYAHKAMALGMHNALIYFHAGMIELKLGQRDDARTLLARALDTNPHFSILHAPEARRTLAMLTGGAR
jgi:tetratricopeptide (TPR) repeat protein